MVILLLTTMIALNLVQAEAAELRDTEIPELEVPQQLWWCRRALGTSRGSMSKMNPKLQDSGL